VIDRLASHEDRVEFILVLNPPMGATSKRARYGVRQRPLPIPRADLRWLRPLLSHRSRTDMRSYERLHRQEMRVIRDLDLEPDQTHDALAAIRDDRSQVEEGRKQLVEWRKTREEREAQRGAIRDLAAKARQRLQNPSHSLMRQVFDLLDLRVQEKADGDLQIDGVIPVPDDRDDEALPLAVGGELRSVVPRDPYQNHPALEFSIKANLGLWAIPSTRSNASGPLTEVHRESNGRRIPFQISAPGGEDA